MENFNLSEEIMEEAIEKQMKNFNWGAFFGTWIWGFGNHVNDRIVYIALFITILQFFHIYFAVILGFILSIYMGIIGNRLAFKQFTQTHKNDELGDFIAQQKRWAVWMFMVFCVIFIISTINGILKSTTTVS